MSETKSVPFDEWALVELFGHQKCVGRVTEATMAGGAFLRVDVPAFNGSPAFTRFYSPGAIYSINPVSEQVARDLMANYRHLQKKPENKMTELFQHFSVSAF